MEQRFELKAGELSNADDMSASIEQACDLMEAIYAGGEYPKVLVKRSWSKHNPVITGEIARPRAYRRYLLPELYKRAKKGATIKILPSRDRLAMDDPQLLDHTDEDEWDITRKKLFLFSPE